VSNDQLLSMLKDFRKMREEDKRAALVSCPICGGPLDVKDGVFNCKMGHFRTTKNTQEQ